MSWETSLEDVIDLGAVVEKARERNGWTESETEYARRWYVRHLHMCQRYPEVRLAAISEKADELWHQHILDTQKYASDCEKLFAKMVHHQPIYGEPSLADHSLHDETLALYEKEFGEVPNDPKMLSSIPM